MTYVTQIAVDTSPIRATRAIAQAAPGLMAAYTQKVIKPAVQQKVNQTFAVYPGPVSSPFEFATAKSRRWYFAQVRAGNIRTDGAHYIRNEDLKKEWIVVIDRRQNEGFLVVKNRASAAIYVFGNRQVPGHQRTGWGASFPQASQEVAGLATYLLAQGWYLILSGKWSG